ncbi:MAG: D-alanyl-D-alanine carboxypeptidase [Lachnospiraceae bacterium]|nr:D-alanyl-D-alanine carboxypeptidase [Lachnospiraceae bacterium]
MDNNRAPRRINPARYRAYRKKIWIRRGIIAGFILTAALLIFGIVKGGQALVRFISERQAAQREVIEPEQEVTSVVALPEEPVEEEKTISPEVEMFFDGYEVRYTDRFSQLVSEEVLSNYAVLIDVETGEIIAGRGEDTVINPASMTKILTLLTAVEMLEEQKEEGKTMEDVLAEQVVIDAEIVDYTYQKGCSQAGFMPEEVVTVEDLLYGTILPSGGDAAMSLAAYVAGDEETFAAKMNEKIAELGLSETSHFTNSVGLYDENHHCTITDMAMMLKAALENDLCREVLSTRIYTTSSSEIHPEGIEISNWFIRRIEDKDNHGVVKSAKTGYVQEAGCCAASYQISDDGGHHICVTADAWSSWRAIYDHVAVYQLYTGENAGELNRGNSYETDITQEG